MFSWRKKKKKNYEKNKNKKKTEGLEISIPKKEKELNVSKVETQHMSSGMESSKTWKNRKGHGPQFEQQDSRNRTNWETLGSTYLCRGKSDG